MHSFVDTIFLMISIQIFQFLMFYILSRLSSWQAFRNVLKEVSDLAGQREVVAESFQAQIIQGIAVLSKNLKEDRKVSAQ